MSLHVSSTCALHHEVKIALHSLWYHHTYRCDVSDEVKIALHSLWYHHTCRCDDTDDEHMYSKHVVAWNKPTVKQNFLHEVG